MARDIGPKLAVDGSEAISGVGIGLSVQVNETAGVIQSLTLLEGGWGYTVSPLTIMHPTGNGAVANITSVDGNGKVTGISLTSGGTEYFNIGTMKQANMAMATLVYLDWFDVDSDTPIPLRLTDASTNLRWYTDKDDFDTYETYQGIGVLGSITDLEEGFDLQSYGITLSLSGIPIELRQQAFADITFKTAYQNRPCKIYIAFLNSNYEIVDEPVLVYAGQMDACNLQIDDSITINLSVQSRLTNWEIPRGGRYNSNDQKKWFPLDTGFDLIPSLLNLELEWGGDGRGNRDNVAGKRSYGSFGGNTGTTISVRRIQ